MTFVESLGNAFRRIKGLKTLDDFFEKVNPNDKVIVRALSQKSGGIAGETVETFEIY
jgi:hypothetical protein